MMEPGYKLGPSAQVMLMDVIRWTALEACEASKKHALVFAHDRRLEISHTRITRVLLFMAEFSWATLRSLLTVSAAPMRSDDDWVGA
jgi:hypothetical protein